jgi:hypothetical protein
VGQVSSELSPALVKIVKLEQQVRSGTLFDCVLTVLTSGAPDVQCSVTCAGQNREAGAAGEQ